ncbi:hypothetical protein PISMIDRAFT_677713 [Pisolithus microcarpus 441]|uniref:Uncharacterized protein n=1 Tax=Pisolithus microcarpus 441 TaxID=765257 RepID=A0A0C9Z6V8_9AGAM|nr:hypothetical protein PISMIDRAFT_677713 [Pisolithus microcarpus 441]
MLLAFRMHFSPWKPEGETSETFRVPGRFGQKARTSPELTSQLLRTRRTLDMPLHNYSWSIIY